MREINLSVTALPARPVPLYYQGENEATVVKIDLTGYVEQFGAGAAKLRHQRPGDAAPYDVKATQQDNILSWTVSAADVQRTGNGRLQLVYTVGETVAHSPIVYTYCSGSLGQETEPPGVALTWTERMEAQIGNLSDLTTTDKSSLVAAINEAAQSGGTSVDLSGYVKSVNGTAPDESGNVNVGFTPEIADNSITGAKTNFMVSDAYPDDSGSYTHNIYHWALRNDGNKHYHSWNKNWNFIGTKDNYSISAVCAYINYVWTVEDPATITDANSLTVVGYGGTYSSYTNLHNSDALTPELHEITTSKPDGAYYLLVDFGYTEPTDVVFNYLVDAYHVQEGGVWTESIKDGAVTTEKIANRSITEEKLVDESVGYEKIKSGAIDVDKLDTSFRRLYVEPYIASENLETYVTSVRAYTGDIPSHIYCIELKAGKTYVVFSASYPRNDAVAADSTQGKSNVNARAVFSSKKIAWSAGNSFEGDLGAGMVYKVLLTMHQNGYVMMNDVLASSSAVYYPNMFSPTIDMYVYFGSYEPIGTQYLVACYSGSFFLEIDEMPYFSDLSKYNPTSLAQITSSAIYVKGYGEYTQQRMTTEDFVSNCFSTERNRMLEETWFRGSRNTADYAASALIIGDSITYAASNAGLQNAWRKYVSTKLNLYELALAVSGTTMTYGYAVDFNGNSSGSESYDIAMTGVRGIKTKLTTNRNQNNTFAMGAVEFAIVALGTNDFGSNAPLGSVDTFDDDGTFYGAAYQLFHFLHDDLRIPYVIFVAPFKRLNWNVNNSADVPYTIYDMVHALAEISLLENDMYVLDCTDRWYLDYDNEAIRAKSFIDYVHITGYAHHMFTIDLALYIQNLVSVRGLRHYKPIFIGSDDEPS